MCDCDVQVQGACDNKGSLMWFSGPHEGVAHDMKLFREFMPPLEEGERLLGDKAYIGLPHKVIPPVKGRKGYHLTQYSRDFNTLHSWYRSSIEHCFAYVKR